jgi:ATP-dependent Clp protease ATP-binding subunit ClpA
MDWALSRSVYHALAAATSEAREHGYPEVTGAHLIAAFLDDPGSVVRRACTSPAMGATIKNALARTSPGPDPRAPATLPVGYAPDVRHAVLGAESDHASSSSTGQVLLRLLTAPEKEATRQLDEIGIDATRLIRSITALVDRGEQDRGEQDRGEDDRAQPDATAA